jgi:hypothetical protein
VTGDWTGTGKTQVGVVDPASNTWYLNTPGGVVHFPYGLPGWVPISGAWTGSSGSAARDRVRDDTASVVPKAATGSRPARTGPLLDAYAVAQLAQAEERRSHARDSLFASGRVSEE